MNFSKRIFRSVLCLAASSAMLSCTSESIKTAYANQEARIETFVNNQLKANSEAYHVSNGGSERVVLAAGEGKELTAGDTFTFRYAGYVFNSGSISASNMFATNDEATAAAAGWSVSGENPLEPMTVRLQDAGFVKGLYNGLLGVKAGEECIILFSGKYGFGGKPSGTIPANSAIAYHIWIDSIGNEQQ